MLDEYLIYCKGELKENVASVKSNPNNKNLYLIEFKNGKTYHYNEKDVQMYKLDDIFIPQDNHSIYAEGKKLFNVDKILCYGDKVKVIFKNSSKWQVYNRKDIEIKNELEAKKVLCYLKETAEFLSSIGSEKEKAIAETTLKRLKSINFPENNTALYNYLTGEEGWSKQDNNETLIFPFGLNTSQLEATKKAFISQISIIEGPPGTGKTQTILNIIANAVMKNKTVAVVAGSNKATINVKEKLDSHGVSFFTAQFAREREENDKEENGKKEDNGKEEKNDKKSGIDYFIENQDGEYPDMSGWKLTEQQKREQEQQIRKLVNELKNMLKKKERTAIIKQELSWLDTEAEHYKTYLKELQVEYEEHLKKQGDIFYKFTTDKIVSFWLEYENFIEQDQRFGFWFKFKNIFNYGIFNWSIYKLEPVQIMRLLHVSYYDVKRAELEDELNLLEQELENYQVIDETPIGFEEQIKVLSSMSMSSFKDYLFDRYKNAVRQKFKKDDLKKQPNKFTSEYPLILSTTNSLRTILGEGYLYDFVIIDEASQVDLITGVLALSCAKQVIIVGDLKQLPNVVASKYQGKLDKIFKKYGLLDVYNYTNKSILASVKERWENVKSTLLREHYRCHPKIIDFCNKKFYDNKLIIMTKDNNEQDVLTAYRTVEGNHARSIDEHKKTRTINRRQIDVIEKEIISSLIEKGITLEDIGIISPYNDQKEEIEKNEHLKNNIFAVDTVHKFQGREVDIVILTTVDNIIREFVDDPNLINVAVSRAVKEFHIIVSAEEHKNTHIGDLIDYIKYNNYEIIDSEIRSVFDLLYKQHDAKRKELYPNSEERIAEDIAYDLISEIIKEMFSGYSLDITRHYSLRLLIKDTDKLTDKPNLPNC